MKKIMIIGVGCNCAMLVADCRDILLFKQSTWISSSSRELVNFKVLKSYEKQSSLSND